MKGILQTTPGRRLPVIGLKLLLLGILNALALWALVILLGDQHYGLAAALLIGCTVINFVYLMDRAYPLRYIVPGLIFTLAMVVYPLGYTVYVSMTNYGTGHLLTKEQVIQQLLTRTYTAENAPLYPYQVYENDGGNLRVLLTAPDGSLLLSDGDRLIRLESGDTRLEDADGDGVTDRIDGYQLLNRLQLIRRLPELQQIVLKDGDSELRVVDLGNFTAPAHQYRYDAEADRLTDTQTGSVYTPQDGFFASETGERLIPGFQTFVGGENFARLLTNKRIAGPFVRVFVWTIEWAFLSVLMTFTVGLGLALLLNDPKLRFRHVYRSLLIVPYALPGFISALIWRGFFNDEVGVINSVLQGVAGVTVPWLQDPLWAKVALVTVNTWLGFPYMLIVCLGALQSIPTELYEASRADGASGWQQFVNITMPLLLVSVGPLLITSFAFNFNNFSLIYLVTQGRPPIPGAETPAGSTDILISYTFRLAFESGSGGDYGLASAVGILIFVLVGTLTLINFRFTKGLERVSENV